MVLDKLVGQYKTWLYKAFGAVKIYICSYFMLDHILENHSPCYLMRCHVFSDGIRKPQKEPV